MESKDLFEGCKVFLYIRRLYEFVFRFYRDVLEEGEVYILTYEYIIGFGNDKANTILKTDIVDPSLVFEEIIFL